MFNDLIEDLKVLKRLLFAVINEDSFKFDGRLRVLAEKRKSYSSNSSNWMFMSSFNELLDASKSRYFKKNDSTQTLEICLKHNNKWINLGELIENIISSNSNAHSDSIVSTIAIIFATNSLFDEFMDVIYFEIFFIKKKKLIPNS